tara:strand:+ start:341 stop:730 length:390 start_codon:yes stop_codon:yes gene_type:complete
MFEICSSSSTRRFVFSDLSKDKFRFELEGDIYAAVDVWSIDGFTTILELFKGCASLDRPWVGSKSWGAIEGDLELFITCTSLGKVHILAKLSRAGIAEEWSAQVMLETEFGQLPSIASDAEAFFGGRDA